MANFYNDISTQMIRCQKTMMLEDAKAFEHLLSNPKDGLGKIITWGNPVALEGYIQRLQVRLCARREGTWCQLNTTTRQEQRCSSLVRLS